MSRVKSLSIISALAGLVILPGLLLAQTTNINTLPTSDTSVASPVPANRIACTQEAKLCSDGSYVSRTGANCEFAACPSVSAPKPSPIPVPPSPSTNIATPPVSTTAVKKCGVNAYRIWNECGAGAFKNAYFQCYDGYEETLGGESSCKPADIWSKYAREACANRCSITGMTPEPKLLPVPAPITPMQPTTLAKPIAICYIPDKLTKDYNRLILELRKAEDAGDKETTELIIKKITALKLEIERARKECLANTAQPPSIQAPTEAPRPAAPVAIDRCFEVSQWENKIAYYEKLAALRDAELKEQTGFSRDEINKILADLPNGLVKVKEQCQTQTNTIVARPATVSQISIAEPVKPVTVESGGEVADYYKAKIETITAEGDAEEQVAKLKSLKTEIDELITKLIKGRKEIEASEIGGLVTELKISKGEIKADDTVVKTTDKKVFFNIDDTPISIEPTADRVTLVGFGSFSVSAEEVSVKDDALWVGNSKVKLAANRVAENLGVAPQAIELKEENAKAVYKLKVAEPRKLFGFIPINVTKTMTADAESSDLLDEKLPWYSFLTIK